jgi:rhamnulokinase
MAIGQPYLAIDLGAESGRLILGNLKDDRLFLSEVYRFGNEAVLLNDGLHWNVLNLWSQIKTGIAAGAKKSGKSLKGIGLDAWGVDFALLDRQGTLLSNPFHYRDTRTDGMLEQAFERMPRSEIFANTGIQFMQINTLYQLLAMVLSDSPLFEMADTLVTIPDLFNYWLSGEITCEFTNATTTQCYNPLSEDWAWSVLQSLGIPDHIFKKIVQPGSVLGNLRSAVALEAGLGDIPVIAPSCHDTGSAVVAVPAEGKNFAWISSGTWSIVGAETRSPLTNEIALDANLTNEGGVFGAWRLSKNVMGLWLVQECRRAWDRAGGDLSYDEITRLAEHARPFIAVIDPDDIRFLHPGDMPARIQAYCRETSQMVPETRGEIIRTALESIALKYRWVLESLEEATDSRLETVHIIGGGAKNQLLNQLTADASRRITIAGPVEATATGNLLMQAITLGDLSSLDEAREIVRHSFDLQSYMPSSVGGWDDAYAKLGKLIEAGTTDRDGMTRRPQSAHTHTYRSDENERHEDDSH